MDRAEFDALTPDQRFAYQFGVTVEELRQKGIDPDIYFQEHVNEVMKDPAIRALVLDDEQLLGDKYHRILGWIWACNFAVLGFLFTTFIPYPYSRPIGISLAFVCVVFAAGAGVAALRAKHQWKQACRAKGIKARF